MTNKITMNCDVRTYARAAPLIAIDVAAPAATAAPVPGVIL